MDITKELETVNREIESISKDYVDARSKAQIVNLLNKIEVRGKLPDFKSLVDGKQVSFIQFLRGINTDVPDSDKPALKKLEKKRIALTVLQETLESKTVKEPTK